LIVKSNTTNRKEYNLRLSGKGLIVSEGQKTFQKELFTFAGTLYERASERDVEVVKALFTAISENMQYRVRQLN
jgi:hypothetical protein